MANNYTDTSGASIVANNLTADQRAHVDVVIDFLNMVSDFGDEMRFYSEEDESEFDVDLDETFKVAITKMEDFAAQSGNRELPESIMTLIKDCQNQGSFHGLIVSLSDGRLDIGAEESYGADVMDSLIHHILILKDAPEDELIFYTDRYYCDKLRLDEFGGGSSLVGRSMNKSVFFNTGNIQGVHDSDTLLREMLGFDDLKPDIKKTVSQQDLFPSEDGEDEYYSQYDGSYMVTASPEARDDLKGLLTCLNGALNDMDIEEEGFIPDDVFEDIIKEELKDNIKLAFHCQNIKAALLLNNVDPATFDRFLTYQLRRVEENGNVSFTPDFEESDESKGVWFGIREQSDLEPVLYMGHLLLALDHNDEVINPSFAGGYNDPVSAAGLITCKGISIVDTEDSYAILMREAVKEIEANTPVPSPRMKP